MVDTSRRNAPIRMAGLAAAFVAGAASSPVLADTEAPSAGSPSGLTPAFHCSVEPTLDPQSPDFYTSDLPPSVPFPSQNDVNCFAWQSFVALTWPVSGDWPNDADSAGRVDRTITARDYGVPRDSSGTAPRPVVVDTFKPAQEIFLPGGDSPSGWGELSDAPAACNGSSDAGAPQRIMTGQSKGGPGAVLASLSRSLDPVINPDETMEAVGGWLTDQDGNLVWFERSVNRAEFQYMDQYGLYQADRQKAVATNADGNHPDGLSLPAGQRPDGRSIQDWKDMGAMETKSAWRILTDREDLWSRFYTVPAWLQEEPGGDCRVEVMGLVGLHIIRKTPTFPNFVWATFEQIDNVPSPGMGYNNPHGFSFNDPNCTGDDCTPNVARCGSGGSDGQCDPLFPKDEPVQVTRAHPLSPDQRSGRQLLETNLAMQEKIDKASGGHSVFQHYELVNVLWTASPDAPVTRPNGQVPLQTAGMTSAGPNTPVANSSMETYAQATNCTACHASATIAGSDTLASDYSFLFSLAE